MPVFLNVYGAPELIPRMNSASLCILAGRYDNPIPPRFLAPIDFLKIPALATYRTCRRRNRFLESLNVNKIGLCSFYIRCSCLRTRNAGLSREQVPRGDGHYRPVAAPQLRGPAPRQVGHRELPSGAEVGTQVISITSYDWLV